MTGPQSLRGVTRRSMTATVPTRLESCPACAGRGSTTVPDRETMRATREAMGVRSVELAREAGWHASFVSELESGARPMTPASAERYWRALHAASRKT